MKENVGNNGPKNLSADPKLARKNIISKLWRKTKMQIFYSVATYIETELFHRI